MFNLNDFTTTTVEAAPKQQAWVETNPEWQALAKAKTAEVFTPTGTVMVSNRYWSEKLVTLRYGVMDYLNRFYVLRSVAENMLTKLNELSTENAQLREEITSLKKGAVPSKK